MKKKYADYCDEILKKLEKTSSPKTIKSIRKNLDINIDQEEMHRCIDILENDEFIKTGAQADGAPVYYYITKKGRPHILNGGYTRKRKRNFIKESNENFTFLRHWGWFIGFVVSLIFNVILLYKLFN